MATERSRRPTLLLRMLNPVAQFLAGTLGLAPAGVMVMRVRRRHSGRTQRAVLNVLVYQGAYHLVSLHGESDWLRNLRAARLATLVRGRGAVPVELAEELSEEERIPVLRAYLQRWDGQLGISFDRDRSATDEELREVVSQVPVVRLKPSA